MRLLVSVASTEDAAAALAGGADVIDAKDPLSGALGPVSPEVFSAIQGCVAGARPVTAAIGDATTDKAIKAAAGTFAAAGAAFVKVGFAGTVDASRVAALTASAVRAAAAHGCRVVAVAYADADRVGTLDRADLLAAAARGGAAGVLLDTADKRSPGLLELVSGEELACWVKNAHDLGLFVALAGRLTAADLPHVRGAGADIAGVRAAACIGGRAGAVSADQVRLLRARAS